MEGLGFRVEGVGVRKGLGKTCRRPGPSVVRQADWVAEVLLSARCVIPRGRQQRKRRLFCQTRLKYFRGSCTQKVTILKS